MASGITGIPVFKDGEIPPAAKLNQLGEAITNKFGGAITPGDMVWPFAVEGNIDFGGTWGIVGLRSLWNIINAAEYATFDDAITAAEGMTGGACVLIPPSTTITADTIDIDASNITIMGCGKSSVLALTFGASGGYFLRTGSGALTDIAIENLTLNGQSVPGQVGVIARTVTGFSMNRVHVKNFDGDAIQITHDGTEGHACIDASLTNVKFSDGGANHLTVIDIDGLVVSNMKSEGCAAVAIDMEPGAVGGLIKRIKMSNIDIDTPVGVGVSILGASGTANDNWSLIDLRDIQISSATTDAFNIGLAEKILKYVTMEGCSAPAAAGDGAKINVSESEILDNFLRSAGGDGIDLLATETSVIRGNNVTDAGTATAIVPGTGGGNYIGQNPGYHATVVSQVHADDTTYTRTGSAGDLLWSYTIPADTLRIGDVLEVEAYFAYTHAAGSLNLQLQVGGTAAGSIGATSASTDGTIRYQLHVVALTGAGTAVLKMVNADTAGTASNELEDLTITLDWTTDLALTFNATSLGAGSTVDVRRIYVRIQGGI